ncbi:hypothetical protein HBI67_190730 [Parastagonospora nodorum]|nr:hypothetical protein HBH46_013000 [Parastagonospora nodorum]KAH4184551.1 hypothetical protein HBH42_191830 [Parastagonospora nodorum]KAH6052152.1 hypothetical protein HBI66_238880 [Parastagonospora nodorum]KAH6056062.1 hypothetical protein HBI67_190730 [Parastagonospora nodorum]
MSDAAFFAMLCDVQLRTDRSATFESRTFFSSEAPIQHLIEESSLTFAPGLADMIRSPDAPSVQQLRVCSVPLSLDDLTLKWIERVMEYEYERSNIPDSIKDLLQRGFERTSHTNLAAVDISFEGEDMICVVALVKALEATFATGFWAYSKPTLISLTPLRFWEEVPWLGLCSHSSLMEITFAGLEDDLPNLDELRLAWKERAELATKKYRNPEKGQASLDKRKDKLKMKSSVKAD